MSSKQISPPGDGDAIWFLSIKVSFTVAPYDQIEMARNLSNFFVDESV